ncbi:MAG: OmpA family protein [Proteobacteria bacterium]|nr:OmpA family protein [Pseudomonadota bacterium]
MVKRLGAVSLVALALVTGAAWAQEDAAQQTEQAEDGAAEQAAPAGLPPEVQAILDDQRALSELNAGELRDRARAARSLARQQGLPDDVRDSLRNIAAATRAELDARQQGNAGGGEQPAPAQNSGADSGTQPEPVPAPMEEQAQQPQEQPAPEAQQPAAEQAQQPVEEPQPPITEQAQEPAAQPEQPAAEQAAPEPQQQPAAEEAKVDPEAEAAARKFLADKTPAEKLDDTALRERLDGIRDLMADKELAPATERALRKKLQTEREVLRQRVALQKEKEGQAKDAKAMEEAAAAAAAEGGGKKKPNAGNNQEAAPAKPLITRETPRRQVLADRRRSEDLTDSELRRRVSVIVEFERDNSYQDYDEDTRSVWRDRVRRDREILRERMGEERRRRARELASADDGLVVNVRPRRDNIRSVFEAEADDEELEDVLIAAPAKKPRQRIRIEDIERQPEVRAAMPRIDIDTIRFGFNEAFVREEEIDNLDRVASIMERILQRNPREIFLIEGHTDAVGSDAYNLQLSKARAEAVKKALTSYFVIPPRNLQTVGLGERYLRIPTQEPEAENRRVSVSRATPFVGELDD